jgi:prolyl-tRNA synthetase
MGSYGIGVSRAVAAVAEQTHDEIGLNWPPEIAPAQIHLVAAGKDEAIFDFAQKLGVDLESAGLSVLLDDRRDASPGVKFKDAELIGIPYIVIVGKSLAEGKIEFRVRKLGSKSEFDVKNAVTEILGAINS